MAASTALQLKMGGGCLVETAIASISLTGSKPSLSLPSSSFMGASLRLSFSATSLRLPSTHSCHVWPVCAAQGEVETEERFRLNNLRPQPGSRRLEKRKGRGIAAGQGASCGFGMRGQNSRSGSGVRPGFEGGQMPLYRRLPKLKGIAGGMGAGLPKYVSVNLEDIVASGVEEGEEVSLESLKLRGLLNPTGRDRKLPLKVLGSGDVTTCFTIKATSFSSSAKEKLEAAGCTLEMVPKRTKFIGGTAKKRQDRATEYFAKKNAVAA